MPLPNPMPTVEGALAWIFAGLQPPSDVTWKGLIGPNERPPEVPAKLSRATGPAVWLRYEFSLESLEGELDPSADPHGLNDTEITIGIQPGSGTEPWNAVWKQVLERIEAFGFSHSVVFNVAETTVRPLGTEDGWEVRLYTLPTWIRGGPEELPPVS